MSLESYLTGILRDMNKLTKRVSAIEKSGAISTMSIGKSREVIISSGAITGIFDHYILMPETGAVDDLDSINFRDANVSLGGKKILLCAGVGMTVTVKDGTGNIDLTGAGGDVALDDRAKSLVLLFDLDFGKWIVYSVNA